jgi:hypothetical protein
LSACLALGLLLAGEACARVPPYRRETLARKDMTFGSRSELLIGTEHARAYREGSSGGGEVRSGGCGCN